MKGLDALGAAWGPDEARLALLLGIATLGYVAYAYLAQALERREPGAARSVTAGRFAGGALLLLPGLCFAARAQPELLSLWRAPALEAWGAAAAIALGLLPILWLSAKSPAQQARYPQIRAERWGPRLVGLEALGWAVYLVGYEWCFRGLLVIGLSASLGLWPALLTGTALYVLAHLTKDLGECLACVLMGLLFGVLTWASASLWPAIGLHLGIALAGNLFPRLRSIPRLRSAPAKAPATAPEC